MPGGGGLFCSGLAWALASFSNANPNRTVAAGSPGVLVSTWYAFYRSNANVFGTSDAGGANPDTAGNSRIALKRPGVYLLACNSIWPDAAYARLTRIDSSGAGAGEITTEALPYTGYQTGTHSGSAGAWPSSALALWHVTIAPVYVTVANDNYDAANARTLDRGAVYAVYYGRTAAIESVY